ncbi:hypothetical protein PanWU01x14_332830 [Parasponia andersonii]|uniref:Uncharacterized protein n=1 Tax=Parasponia andersonii TaxID=3476 RepID=A0A2P5AH69_PARAD|nr:hypothetical protein PanWU01x14_332830 [Parasponia andersonii]
MLRSKALSSAKNKLKQMYPLKDSWGTLATTTTKKPGKDVSSEGGTVKEKGDNPIVVFSKPPPVPPVLGPLIALSLLETWLNRDGNDD